MERLTSCNKEMPSLTKDNSEYWLKIYFKLKAYEDLEEQGLLLKLPCKVGDTVYFVEGNEIEEISVSHFDVCMKGIYAYYGHIFIGKMGFSVFATKEEAEKALEKMEK